MASKNTSSNSRQAVQRSNSDSARWIAGLLLLFIGLFAAAAVFFSFFSWAADQSGLQKSVEERVTLGIEPENLCGWAGARLGMLLVDHSFGLFGILIPAMIVLVGVRIVRQRPLLFNHSILSLFLIMILGSLTLGFAFGDKWSLCSSTGWGGAFGIETGALLHTHIGVFGTLILLVGCWILTGVFINRNFINKVNRAGNVMVDKSGRIVEIVKHKVVPGHLHAEEADGAVSAAATPAASASNPNRAKARPSGSRFPASRSNKHRYPLRGFQTIPALRSGIKYACSFQTPPTHQASQRDTERNARRAACNSGSAGSLTTGLPFSDNSRARSIRTTRPVESAAKTTYSDSRSGDFPT